MLFNREHIFRMIRDDRSAVLLGSDIKLYSTMKTNTEIIKTLTENCEYPSGFPLSLPEIGEYYAEMNGKSQLVEKVLELVESDPGESNLLKLLAAVKSINVIFAMTMDECIQSFFPQKELVVIRSDMDVARAISRPRKLYRLNGTISNVDTMLLTKADLVTQLSNVGKSPLLAHLLYNLSTRLFLIIGCNLREWNISFYLELITSQLGEFREKAVLFCENPDPVLVAHWNKRNIEVLEESPSDFLSEYLNWEAEQ